MTASMITMCGVTVILCVLAIAVGRHPAVVPTGLQNVAEAIVEKLYGFFCDLMGEKVCRKYLSFVATLLIMIVIYNYIGLIPGAGKLPFLQAPTGSINTPLALALIVFVAVQVIGIKDNGGPRFYKHFFHPVAFVFPLMIIEEFVHPLSLCLRLYGNIHGEETVTEVLAGLIPIGVPLVMEALSVLMGFIQAMVFALLAAIYITDASTALDEENH